jgi:hypothetical protein
MRRLLIAAFLGFATTSAGAQLPASLDEARVRSCAPATIEAATDCLRSALSAEDLAVLVGSSTGGGYRGYIDAFLVSAWQLDDPTAPLPRHMSGRDLYLTGSTSAGLIISNLGAVMRGRTLNWSAVSAALRRPAVERSAVRPNQETKDAD